MTRRAFDRHRGGGHPPTPATPPCVRVRTRRFELVTLAFIDQRWKSERFEVSIGKPHREGFGPGQIPGAESAASRVAGESRANPQFYRSRFRRKTTFRTDRRQLFHNPVVSEYAVMGEQRKSPYLPSFAR